MARVDVDRLRELVAKKYLSVNVHPDNSNVLIWNYTQVTQFGNHWTHETMMCRGLITTADGEIIARPFPKFFNIEQTQGQALPNEAFEVTMKMDGCFLESTALNLWDGGTITIGEVVRNKLTPTLIGMDENGQLVPCQVVDYFDNGTKDYWLDVTLSNPVSRKSGSGGHLNKMRVTPNHHVWLNGAFKPICEAQIGDNVMTFEPRISRASGHEFLASIDASIVGIEPVSLDKKNFPAGRRGLDIKTTTGNYFAKGILVHNSLGILYFLDGQPYIATRGSFTSDQALHATALYRERYAARHKPHPAYTYLFEIIFPQNRIVVDYGDMDDLVLIGVIHTETGAEIPLRMLHDQPFPIAKVYDGVKDFAELRAQPVENEEGFVVRFEKTNLRVKLKHEEYVRLHRILTNVTERTVWECLLNDTGLDAMLDRVPDEFYGWIQATVARFNADFCAIESAARKTLMEAINAPTRKEQAEIIKHGLYPQVTFAMLDNHDYRTAIWKRLRPAATKPFKMDIDA